MITMNEMENSLVFDGEGNGHVKGSGFGGKYTDLPTKLRNLLRKPMPKDAIKTHPTKTYLSTVKAVFIAERMHDVFGLNGWDVEHEVVGATGDYVLMKGRIYLRQFDLYTPYQFGGHSTSGKGTEPADGYKSAVTDIQSKCCAHLEVAIDVFKGNPDATELTPAATKPTPLPASAPKTNPEGLDKPMADVPAKPVAKKAAPKKPAAKKAPVKVEPAVEDVASEDVVATPSMDKHFDEIAGYDSITELLENAEAIVFNAQMDGATPDQIKEIKEAVNDQFTKLKQ